MKPVHICVPVLNRYDLLRNLLLSLSESTVRPAGIYIVDNGRDHDRLTTALMGLYSVVHTPEYPMGLAESWNWFIQNVPEERLITNDDILFAPDSLEKMVNTEGEIVTALLKTNACSCFLIRDSCVEKVGLFDENISPGYAYFEDCDYDERLQRAGLDFVNVECGVVHLHSQTIAAMTTQQREAHHDKFVRAQENFIKKWGRMPHGKERQTV